MADAEEALTFQELGQWFRRVGVDQENERIEGLSKIAFELSSSLTEGEIDDFVRMAFATRQPPTSSAIKRVEEAVTAIDANFDARQNALEVQMLAAAVLAAALKLDNRISSIVALELASAAFGGGRAPSLPLDLLGVAFASLQRMAISRRSRPDISRFATAVAISVAPNTGQAKAKEASPEALAAALGQVSSAAGQSLNALAKRDADLAAVLQSYLRVQDEESQLLWWLVGERTWDGKRTFKQVPELERPFVLANDASELTEVLPGIHSISALLARCGLDVESAVTLPELVNYVDDDWLRGRLGDRHPSPVTQPIHCAIQKRLETGKGDAWLAGWAATTELDPNRSFSPLDIGVMFYRERLIAKALG